VGSNEGRSIEGVTIRRLLKEGQLDVAGAAMMNECDGGEDGWADVRVSIVVSGVEKGEVARNVGGHSMASSSFDANPGTKVYPHIADAGTGGFAANQQSRDQLPSSLQSALSNGCTSDRTLARHVSHKGSVT